MKRTPKIPTAAITIRTMARRPYPDCVVVARELWVVNQMLVFGILGVAVYPQYSLD
jgi:hypothetical protein